MVIAESRTDHNKQIVCVALYSNCNYLSGLCMCMCTDDYCKSIQLQSLAYGAHTQVKFKGACGYTR